MVKLSSIEERIIGRFLERLADDPAVPPDLPKRIRELAVRGELDNVELLLEAFIKGGQISG